MQNMSSPVVQTSKPTSSTDKIDPKELIATLSFKIKKSELGKLPKDDESDEIVMTHVRIQIALLLSLEYFRIALSCGLQESRSRKFKFDLEITRQGWIDYHYWLEYLQLNGSQLGTDENYPKSELMEKTWSFSSFKIAHFFADELFLSIIPKPPLNTIANINEIPDFLINDYVNIFLEYLDQKFNHRKNKKINEINTKNGGFRNYCRIFDPTLIAESQRNLPYDKILKIFCNSGPIGMAELIWDGMQENRDTLLLNLCISHKKWNTIKKTCPTFDILYKKYGQDVQKSQTNPRISELYRKISTITKMLNDPRYYENLELSIRGDGWMCGEIQLGLTEHQLIAEIKKCEREIANIEKMMQPQDLD